VSAVVNVLLAAVIVGLSVHLFALHNCARRRGIRVTQRTLAAAHDAPARRVDPIDWDAVARRDTQPMRRIEVAS